MRDLSSSFYRFQFVIIQSSESSPSSQRHRRTSSTSYQHRARLSGHQPLSASPATSWRFLPSISTLRKFVFLLLPAILRTIDDCTKLQSGWLFLCVCALSPYLRWIESKLTTRLNTLEVASAIRFFRGKCLEV